MNLKYQALKDFSYDEREFQVMAFDIDGTLTRSKEKIEAKMVDLLRQLLEHKQIAILSGGDYPQFQKQILKEFRMSDEKLFKNLFLFPDNASEFYVWSERINNWEKVYHHDFSAIEKKHIFNSIKKAIKITETDIPNKIYGQLIEDRGGEITFSALGQHAPVELKMRWDPDHRKKEILQKYLAKMLPNFSVKVGGSTSLDVTKKNIDKAYGLKYLEEYLNLSPDKILYVGDALFEGGNDEVVLKNGVKAVNVENEKETKKLLTEILSNILRNKKSEISPVTDLRPWGQMREFEKNKPVSTKIIIVKKGEELSLQSHKLRGEFWRVLKGNPEVTQGILKTQAKAGDEFIMKPGVLHQIKAIVDEVEILEISYGKFLEEDIVRFKDKYGRK